MPGRFVLLLLAAWPACALALTGAMIARRVAVQQAARALAAAALLPRLPTEAAGPMPKPYARIVFATPGDDFGEVTVELTRGANEEAVALFAALCAGSLAAPCDRTIGQSAVLAREKLEKNKALQSCLAAEGQPLSYDGATVWRVVPGQRIDAGALASAYNLRLGPPVVGDNSNGQLKHDQAGVVSMRRGVQAGTFLITPAAAPSLDEDYVIVGRVVRGLDVVSKLNAIPTIRSGNGVGYQAFAGDIAGRDRPVKSCRYGSAELYCTDGKPLRKVTMRTRLADSIDGSG
jgi:cyclophilin family peptidyl-prolyl cis-trans isomerase